MEHARRVADFDEIFCLTFVRGVDPAGALRRMGAYPDTVRPRAVDGAGDLMEDFDLGFPRMAYAVELGGWSVVVEPEGFEGSDRHLLAAVSRGTEAVAVLRHDYAASHFFGHAVDGTVVAGFPPEHPVDGRMWGADPARLAGAMREVGLAGDRPDDPVARAILLAERVAGVTVPEDLWSLTALSGQIEPWFVTAGVDQARPTAELVAAIEAADPATLRPAAVAEVRRAAEALGVAGTPGLDDYLDRVPEAVVGMGSDLGRHVRDWLAGQSRASWSLNGHHRGRMSDEQRRDAYALGWFVGALKGVADADPRVALLAAVKPVTSGIPAFGGLDDFLNRWTPGARP